MKPLSSLLASTIVALASAIGLAEQPENEEPGSHVERVDQVAASAEPVEGTSCSYFADDCVEVPQSTCCDKLCGDCATPRFVGHVDWVYMWRDRPQSTDIFFNPAGAPLLNASDFQFNPRSGIDAGFTMYKTCDTGVDFRYLWLDEFSSTIDFVVPNGVNHLNTTPQSYFIGANDLPASFRYSSKLQTVEVNLRREWARVNWLVGFRYVDFHETLEGIYQPPGVLVETETWGSDRNNLYGVQAGLEALLWQSTGQKLQVNGSGKAGIYYNDIYTHFNTRFFQSPDDPVYSNAHASKASFLGEIGLNAVYQVSSHLALRGGYQLMWLSGVATAGIQVPATGNFNGSGGRVIDSSVDSNGSVFLHGLNTGLEVKW